jgi:hypothetical protein
MLISFKANISRAIGASVIAVGVASYDIKQVARVLQENLKKNVFLIRSSNVQNVFF